MKFLFYKPIKVSNSPDNVFVWSDTHFNHKCEHWTIPLWKARGYDSVELHNEGLIKNWNLTVRPDSTAFHLGDFIFGMNSYEQIKNILTRLNFKDLYIMPGNHSSGWKQLFEQVKLNVWNISEDKRVIMIPNYAETIVDGQMFVLSHYPILSYNGQSRGAICLYGHVHGNMQSNNLGKLYAQAKTMEVTVEASSTPVSFEYITNYFSKKPTLTFDHHGQ